MTTVSGELSDWEAFNAYAHSPGPGYFGFKADIGDINRFAARYRAAKCFRSIDLEGYTNNVRA
jgi:hypothetical protein